MGRKDGSGGGAAGKEEAEGLLRRGRGSDPWRKDDDLRGFTDGRRMEVGGERRNIFRGKTKGMRERERTEGGK